MKQLTVTKTSEKRWVKIRVNFLDALEKPSKIKGLMPCNSMKYGLKAARRAPQFSKR